VKCSISRLSAGALVVVLMASIFAGVLPTFAQDLATVPSGAVEVGAKGVHDINISIKYSSPTGIRIKEVSGPDIAHDEKLIVGTDYWIKSRAINQGDFNDSVKETVKITGESGNIVFEAETNDKTIDVKSGGDFSKKWNTSTLTPDIYTIFMNATIKGYVDANPENNNRTREVTLEMAAAPIATTGEIIISEMMYAPSSTWGGGQNEWVELLNNDTEAINLVDWTIDGKSIPGVVIQSGDYLIIAKNDTKFSEFYLNVTSTIVKLTISLKDGGEEVLLNDSTGTVNDALNYTNYASGGLKWGYKNNKTIWLNESGGWEEGLVDGGTPGAPNSLSTPTDENPPTIEFVDPSPANGSEINVDYVLINVTLNETGDVAILNWNGVNETMSGSEMNFYKDKTGLSDGIYTFKVYASDTNGNMGTSETRVITMNLTAPTAPNVVINEFVSNNATEWVELYNKGSTDINLSGWTMKDEGGNIKHLSGLISANAYTVFSYSSWLNNGGDTIWLNSTSGEMDYVAYGSSGDAPSPDAGKSAGRFPNGIDTDNDSGDFREFEIPTKGDENMITVGPTYGVSLSQPVDQTTIPGVNATYEILVSNTGDQDDTFSLTSINSDYADTAELSVSSIYLNASESVTLFLHVSDDDAGTYNVSVNVTSMTDSDATDEVTVTTKILPMSISSFVAENGALGCTLNASVTIKNDGDSKVNVTVVVSGLHEITGYPLAGTGVVVNLGGAEMITLPILVYLPAGADTGSYSLFADTWIQSDYPDLQKAITFEEEVIIITS